jgi:hypothetical protein
MSKTIPNTAVGILCLIMAIGLMVQGEFVDAMELLALSLLLADSVEIKR